MAPAGKAREVNASRQTRRTDECQRPGVMSKWDWAQPYNCSEYIIWGVHSIVYVLRTPYNEMGFPIYGALSYLLPIKELAAPYLTSTCITGAYLPVGKG